MKIMINRHDKRFHSLFLKVSVVGGGGLNLRNVNTLCVPSKLAWMDLNGCKFREIEEVAAIGVQYKVCHLAGHCDLEDSSPVFLYDNPFHGDAPPCQVWSQKAEWFRR